MWREQMIDTVACEQMLGRLTWKNDMVNEQWESFSGNMSGGENLTLTRI